MEAKNSVIELFPVDIRKLVSSGGIIPESYEEIHIKRNGPVVFRKGQHFWYLGRNGELIDKKENMYIADAEKIDEMISYLCRFSLYSVRNQIKQGYITLKGGHRAGIAGEMTEDDNGDITGIRCISSVNLRIAHEVKGCADDVMQYISENGRYLNTIIISAPGKGKTTLLRDMVRQLSDGSLFLRPMRVGLADERNEVAASVDGIAQNDVGINTDVNDRGSKLKTMKMLLRTMNPEILAADEIGNEKETELFRLAKSWGTGLLTTMHGSVEEAALEKSGADGIFDRIIEIKNDTRRMYSVYDAKSRRIASFPAKGETQ